MKMMTGGRTTNAVEYPYAPCNASTIIVAVISFSILLLRYKEVTSAQ